MNQQLNCKVEISPWTHEIPPTLGTTELYPTFRKPHNRLSWFSLGSGVVLLWPLPLLEVYSMAYDC